MWDVRSLFGDSAYPDHHAAVHAEAHADAADRMPVVGEHCRYSAGEPQPQALCAVCHAGLLPHEYRSGVCDDRDQCAWRSLTERCCH